MSQAAEARRLLRSLDTAVLATLEAAGGGPYGSLVLVAADHDARPLLLLSDLAEHSRNLAADPRVSLLFDGTVGLDSRLTGPRLSLQGGIERSREPRHRARFLARHPDAAAYADFGDFAFYVVRPTRAHLVAGFGRIDWLAADEVLQADALALPLLAQEAGIVAHMNQDHADAVQLYARVLAGRPAGGWRMTGCDSEGIDLRAGGEVCRLGFAAPVGDAQGARAELVRMVQQAREIQADSAGPG